MDGPDYPQDSRPGTPNNVPSLIHDYRAQREAWREQARNLARMREEVLSAADREAHDIVSSARGEIRRILLKARRDLLVLAAQVRAAGRLGEAEDTPDTGHFLPANDLGQAEGVLTSARLDVRRVLDESRPELEGLVAESDALRAALRQRTLAPAATPDRPKLSPPSIADVAMEPLTATPIDFEFTSIAADNSPDLTIPHRPQRLVQALIATAAMLGGIAVMGTWWFYGPQSDTPASSSVSAKPDVQPGSSRASLAPAARTTAAARTASAVSARTGALSLNVAARRNAWIRVTVDGRVTTERTLKQGETQQVTAAREISIRAGDAGAVMVSVNGQRAVPLGGEGEVITRRYPAPATRPPSPPPAAASPSVPVAATPRPPALTAPTTTAPGSTASRGAETPAAVSAPPPAAPVIPPVNQTATATAPVPKPPAASVDRSVVVPAPAPTSAALEDSMTAQVTRWLDAYYRQDRATMTAIAPAASIADDRPDKERLPRGLPGVKRSLDDVKFRIFSESEAMLTARMTERMENAGAGQMASAVSFVSHMWTLRNGTWYMHDVRIVSPATLSRGLSSR